MDIGYTFIIIYKNNNTNVHVDGILWIFLCKNETMCLQSWLMLVNIKRVL